jgi:hypothetical protein
MVPILNFLISSGSKKMKTRCACLSEAKASHSHKMWTCISSSVPHFLQVWLLLNPITYRCLLKVLRPVRRPITTLRIPTVDYQLVSSPYFHCQHIQPTLFTPFTHHSPTDPTYLHLLTCFTPSSEPTTLEGNILIQNATKLWPSNNVTYPRRHGSSSINKENIQGNQKVSVHLMITTQLATCLNLTAWQLTASARGTLHSH